MTHWAGAPTDVTRPAPLAGAGRLAGAAALIAVLTVASRLAGFGRTAVFTWSLAPTDLGGAYVVANAVPNFIFEIVAGERWPASSYRCWPVRSRPATGRPSPGPPAPC